MSSNIFLNVEYANRIKSYANGLSSYTQSNCQVTLTDNGFRIYRPPNKTVSTDGNTMWGGLKLRNRTSSGLGVWTDGVDNMWGLTTGHTYVLMFHVKGQTTNRVSNLGWDNQMGWGGGGLSPSPSSVSHNAPSANFNGETDFYYKWTINDSIKKTCTTTYSYATAGKDYISYCDFKFGFEYTDTGTLGTDLYLTNFRMYDITNGSNSVNLLNTGIINCINATEYDTKTVSLHQSGLLNLNEIKEY